VVLVPVELVSVVLVARCHRPRLLRAARVVKAAEFEFSSHSVADRLPPTK